MPYGCRYVPTNRRFLDMFPQTEKMVKIGRYVSLFSTIKKCDRTLVIEDGAIRETGTYDELMDQHGLFEQLVLSDENKDK